jgi:hypothetical protein
MPFIYIWAVLVWRLLVTPFCYAFYRFCYLSSQPNLCMPSDTCARCSASTWLHAAYYFTTLAGRREKRGKGWANIVPCYQNGEGEGGKVGQASLNPWPQKSQHLPQCCSGGEPITMPGPLLRSQSMAVCWILLRRQRHRGRWCWRVGQAGPPC